MSIWEGIVIICAMSIVGNIVLKIYVVSAIDKIEANHKLSPQDKKKAMGKIFRDSDD